MPSSRPKAARIGLVARWSALEEGACPAIARVQCLTARSPPWTTSFLLFLHGVVRDDAPGTAGLVTLVRICRQLTNGRLSPSRLKTRHFRKGMPAALRTFLGVDIEFGANADEIWFPRPIALLSVVGRDEYQNELLRRYAEEALARKPRERVTIRSKAEDILSKLLPHGKATASEVALRLAMSSRTLSRKLGEEGTSCGDTGRAAGRPRQTLSS